MRKNATRLLGRILATGLVVTAALGASGCAERPTMRLHHAEIRFASLQGVGLDIVMAVDNTNSFDIQIRNVRVEVLLAERYNIPAIDYSPNTWLPAGQKTLLRVPVVIPYTLIPQLINDTANTPQIKYHVRGSADVTATRSFGVERDNYPIDEGGSIARNDMLAAAGIRF
jgi:LEA14-like dessication related protein